MTDSLLRMRGGSFGYGPRPVFQGLDLDVAPGQIVSILGPNGCGKTTLLRCLSGALELRSGSVSLDGRELKDYDAAELARSLGIVYQDHSPVFPFTVLEVISMGRTPYLSRFASPSRQDLALAEESMDKVGIRHLRDQRYTEISGGERQLVLIARTLAQRPKLIILDEPTSHLDFGNQSRVLRLVRALANEGIAIVMTTHNPNHVLLFPNTVALMDEGRFVAVGKAEEVVTEGALLATYGIAVHVFTVPDPRGGKTMRLVSPDFAN